jgi:hypothetical protein
MWLGLLFKQNSFEVRQTSGACVRKLKSLEKRGLLAIEAF